MVPSHQSNRKQNIPPAVKNRETFVMKQLLTIVEKIIFKAAAHPIFFKNNPKDDLIRPKTALTILELNDL